MEWIYNFCFDTILNHYLAQKLKPIRSNLTHSWLIPQKIYIYIWYKYPIWWSLKPTRNFKYPFHHLKNTCYNLKCLHGLYVILTMCIYKLLDTIFLQTGFQEWILPKTCIFGIESTAMSSMGSMDCWPCGFVAKSRRGQPI